MFQVKIVNFIWQLMSRYKNKNIIDADSFFVKCGDYY